MNRDAIVELVASVLVVAGAYLLAGVPLALIAVGLVLLFVAR